MRKAHPNLSPSEQRAIGLRYLIEKIAPGEAENIARQALKSDKPLYLTRQAPSKEEALLNSVDIEGILASALKSANASVQSHLKSPPTIISLFSLAVANLIEKLGLDAADFVEQWTGSINSWVSRPQFADAALANDTSPPATYLLAEVAPETLFPTNLLQTSLDWVGSPIRVMAARRSDGVYDSLFASVAPRREGAGQGLVIVELAGADGDAAALSLSAAAPTMKIMNPSLVAEWDALTVRVFADEVV